MAGKVSFPVSSPACPNREGLNLLKIPFRELCGVNEQPVKLGTLMTQVTETVKERTFICRECRSATESDRRA
jgi:hypothetical protein